MSEASSGALVSICIPVYNRQDFVLDAIRSAQHQTINNLEIVVVDNASTDATYEVVYSESKKDNRIKLYKNDINIGALKNFYRSIVLSKTKYVVLLGSDDWLEPDFVASRLKGFALYPEVAMVSGPVKIFEQINNDAKLIASYKYSESIKNFDYVCKNFYKKFIISYFCMFKKDEILNSFHFTYHDPYNWQVYDKGLGLDLINCLSALSKSKNKNLYYISSGAYCFRNHKKRESENIIEDAPKIDKTINDFIFNTFLFQNFLALEGKTYRILFLKYRFVELLYEVFRELIFGNSVSIKTFTGLKKFIKINKINYFIGIRSIIFLPFFIIIRTINFCIRKLIYKNA